MMATLFAVVGLFAICQLPRLIVRISVLLLKQSTQIHLNDDAVQRAQNIASGLLVVHATANFFLYCLVGKSFRRGLARLCSRRPARSSTCSRTGGSFLVLPGTARSATLTTERREELLLSRHHKPTAADHT